MKETLANKRMSVVLTVGLIGAALIAVPGTGLTQQSQEPTTLDEVQAEFSDAFAAIGDFTADQRDAALAEMETTLQRLDERIDETEARVREEWAAMSEATREQTSAALSAMREQRNRLSESYGALSQGASTAWDDLMDGVQAGWADLETAWDDATAAMSDNTETGD
jgi:chromosome segregation ATPase